MKCPNCDLENPEDSKFCRECGTNISTSDDGQPSITQTIETPREELTTGSTFAGRYQIIEELGKGGMGRVYKVLDTEIQTKVALKLIEPEIASQENTIERFRNELKVARDISHPNVCRMYDLNREEGRYYSENGWLINPRGLGFSSVKISEVSFELEEVKKSNRIFGTYGHAIPTGYTEGLIFGYPALFVDHL